MDTTRTPAMVTVTTRLPTDIRQRLTALSKRTGIKQERLIADAVLMLLVVRESQS